MVDFPEGYGFKPLDRQRVMQPTFHLTVGVFRRAGTWAQVGKRGRRSPYEFEGIGMVYKLAEEHSVSGKLYGEESVVKGTLQQVVTALCTLHRLRGSK